MQKLLKSNRLSLFFFCSGSVLDKHLLILQDYIHNMRGMKRKPNNLVIIEDKRT